MAYRKFADQRGREWEVWQVIPPHAELRKGQRRSLPDRRRVSRPNSVERRVAPDRRVTRSPRVHMSPGFERGWLCFASGKETRRLIPIPAGWTRASPDQLELWSHEAKAMWKRPTRD